MWRNGVISRLPLPANADSAEPDGINSLERIVGYANEYTDFPQTDPEEPLFWHDGVVTVLPIPSGPAIERTPTPSMIVTRSSASRLPAPQAMQFNGSTVSHTTSTP